MDLSGWESEWMDKDCMLEGALKFVHEIFKWRSIYLSIYLWRSGPKEQHLKFLNATNEVESKQDTFNLLVVQCRPSDLGLTTNFATRSGIKEGGSREENRLFHLMARAKMFYLLHSHCTFLRERLFEEWRRGKLVATYYKGKSSSLRLALIGF